MKTPKVPYPDWVVAPVRDDPRKEEDIHNEVRDLLNRLGYKVVEGQRGFTGKVDRVFMAPGNNLDLTIYGKYPEHHVIELKRPSRYGEPLTQLLGQGQEKTILDLRSRGWSAWVAFDLDGVLWVVRPQIVPTHPKHRVDKR